MVPSHERRKSGLWPLQMAIDQHHTQCALLLLEHASYDAAIFDAHERGIIPSASMAATGASFAAAAERARRPAW